MMNEFYKGTSRHRIGTTLLKGVMLLLLAVLALPVLEPVDIGSTASAQSKKKSINVSGLVTDTAGDPLIGATISIKGSDSGGISSKKDGTFQITVPQGTVLVFSYLGYKDHEQTATTRMDVALETDAQQMEDVVVVGYTKQSMREVSASVAKIDMKALENNSSVSLATMLSGQAAGLQTVIRSGVPGASNTGIVIRGNTSLSSSNDITGISNPLYIVDGIPMSLQDIAGYNVTDNDFLASLNPQDIQSIDILKDAAATAIYGSRGANGVVIITTRKGMSGDARITARISQGVITRPAKLAVYVGQEEREAKIAILQKTLTNLYGDMDWFDIRQSSLLEILGYALPAVLTDKYNPAFNNAYDYQSMFYQNGSSQNYDLSMEGGNNSNSYRVSLGRYEESGVLVGYGLSRTNFSSSLVTDINKHFHNELVVRYSYLDRRGGLNDQMKAMPTSPTELPSSLFYRTDEELKQLSGQLGDAYNKNESHNLSIGETLRIKILDNLSIDNQLSSVLDFGKRDYFIPSTATNDGRSLANSYSSATTTTNASSVINYNTTFGKNDEHAFVALLGAELNTSTLNQLRVEAIDGMSDYLKVVQGYKKENTYGYSDIVTSNMLSFFTMLSYGYKENRYKIEGVFRRDGSSRFGANNKWANFPSLKVHWAFSEEDFMAGTKSWLDFAKLRVSYGTSGDIYYDPLLQYNSLLALSSISGGLGSVSSNQMDVKTYGSKLALVSDFNKIANKDLSWSRSKEINYGADIEMFGRRLNLTVDLYSKYLSDMIYSSTLPKYVGFNQLSSNLVDMVSNGYEVSLTGYLFPRTSKVQWDFTLNLAHNTTIIAKMGNNGRDYINADSNYAFVVGAPAFQYYMYEYAGALDEYSDLPVDPFTGEALKYTYADAGLGRNLQGRIFPGMPIFTDVNGDYLVDGSYSSTDTKIIANKSAEPKITGGLSTCFRYKDLSIRINSSFAFGHWIFNTTLQQQLSRFDSSQDFYQYALYKFDDSMFWSAPGDGSYYPMIYVDYMDGGSARTFRVSSMFLEPGDYWNIDNLTISYNLPQRWTKAINMRGINVYATGSNLFMWKRSQVLDPRMVSRTGFYNGSGYPISKTFTFGVQLQF
ncbi:MAG: SusC/RagA family TonB-linked outer membrane protein [Tidjanibacter sp.]|nr:SusC/RagA family TonB-linked outer membrane protein [Tidjanibacter sp.]